MCAAIRERDGKGVVGVRVVERVREGPALGAFGAGFLGLALRIKRDGGGGDGTGNARPQLFSR